MTAVTFEIGRESGASWTSWSYVVRGEGEVYKSQAYASLGDVTEAIARFAGALGMTPRYDDNYSGRLEREHAEAK